MSSAGLAMKMQPWPSFPFPLHGHGAGRARSIGAGGALALLLSGCSGVLDPQGPISASERLILLDSLAIMLVIVVPVIVATFAFGWWFRGSNTKAVYLHDWAFSGRLELIVWAIPALVILFLGGIAWYGSHELDPWQPIASDKSPIEIEAVSLDWKWLFIYPDRHIATLNQLVVPAGTPLHFRLTSATVMNSFFVPQLGSQIYTMSGMTSQLNLQADKPGIYRGLSAHFSGDGFSDMHFDVRAMAQADFDKWVTTTGGTGPTLDMATYARLAAPSGALPPTTYRNVAPDLFEAILNLKTPQPRTQQQGDDTSPRKGT